MVIGATDEGRFGRISDPRRCWAPKGIRPVAPRQIVREFLYVYTAVVPKRGKICSLLLPYANSEMMSLFLAEVSTTFSNTLIVLRVDQAGWHVSDAVTVPENIRLVFQPAHRPELNPTEHIWEDLREKEMANFAFESLSAVEQQLCSGLNRLSNNPDYLCSLTDFPFLQIHF